MEYFLLSFVMPKYGDSRPIGCIAEDGWYGSGKGSVYEAHRTSYTMGTKG
jgi:hypothetical protein